MINEYKLKEVWIPVMKGEKQKCNIFMSDEFKNPDPKVNKKKKALLLI